MERVVERLKRSHEKAALRLNKALNNVLLIAAKRPSRRGKGVR